MTLFVSIKLFLRSFLQKQDLYQQDTSSVFYYIPWYSISFWFILSEDEKKAKGLGNYNPGIDGAKLMGQIKKLYRQSREIKQKWEG